MGKPVYGVTLNSVKEKCSFTETASCPRHKFHVGGIIKNMTEGFNENTIEPDMYVNKNRILFKTVHGSHLYGLNHASSDLDYYVVVEDSGKHHFKTKQTIVDGVDSTVIGYNAFMENCFKGVPQALEAMFSDKATIDEFGALRQAYKAGGSSVTDVYLRTIFNFSRDGRRGGLKYKKHAVRLALNLNSILESERFNPTLNVNEIKLVTDMHVLPQEEFEKKLNSVSLIQIFS